MTANQATPKAPELQETVPAAGKPLSEEQLAGIAGGNGFTDVVGEGLEAGANFAQNFIPGVGT